MPSLPKTNCLCRSWRQIDMSASYEGTAIVDAHHHTAIVANTYHRAEWEGTVCGCHRRAIQALAIRGAMTAKSVSPTVNACYFGVSKSAQRTQQRRGQKRKLPTASAKQKLWHK